MQNLCMTLVHFTEGRILCYFIHVLLIDIFKIVIYIFIYIYSHFDGVRALAFHPVEPVLITASEDHTLKLWNLQKTVPAKKYVFSAVRLTNIR